MRRIATLTVVGLIVSLAACSHDLTAPSAAPVHGAAVDNAAVDRVTPRVPASPKFAKGKF